MQQISPNSRKLLPTISISPSSTSHSSKILTKNRNNESPNNNFTVKPPLDSAMALAVLVLILALFFMGFFSVYMRRLADVSSIDTARRRRRGSNTTSFRLRVSGVGVDPAMIESLPVHVYNGGVEKQEISGAGVELECVICLSEFEERECVKKIPYCGHVFHVECIDTWLMSHVTCPLCRAAKLFPNEGEGHVACGEEGGSGVGEVHGNDDGSDREVRLMVQMNERERDGMM